MHKFLFQVCDKEDNRMTSYYNHDYRPECLCNRLYFFYDYPVSPYFAGSKISNGWINLVTVNCQHLQRYCHHCCHHYRPQPVIQQNTKANCHPGGTLADYFPCVRTKRRKGDRRNFRSRRNILPKKLSTSDKWIGATGKTIPEPAFQTVPEPAFQRGLFTDVLKRNLKIKETKIGASFKRESEIRDMKKNAEKLSNNIILAGTSVTPFSPMEDTSEVAHKIIQDCCCINIPMCNINYAYRQGKAPKKGLPDKRNIKVFLSDNKTKIDIINAKVALRKTTASGLYINEQLLPSVATLFYHLRMLRKENQNKIGTLHTLNGIIHVRKNRKSQVYEILTKEDFKQFLEEVKLPNPL